MTFGLFPKAQLDGYSAFLILGAVMRRREFIALAGGSGFLRAVDGTGAAERPASRRNSDGVWAI